MENILNSTAGDLQNSPTLNLRSLRIENRRLAIALTRALMDYTISLYQPLMPVESFCDVNLGQALETAVALVVELDLSTVETALVLLEDGFEGSAKQLIYAASALSA